MNGAGLAYDAVRDEGEGCGVSMRHIFLAARSGESPNWETVAQVGFS